ncbi:MAG: hypothetical protein KDD50_03365 [Bdellovibrionales bacterium]|nr:hypothetical protein [Bdellovibrionales bacterium]
MRLIVVLNIFFYSVLVHAGMTEYSNVTEKIISEQGKKEVVQQVSPELQTMTQKISNLWERAKKKINEFRGESKTETAQVQEVANPEVEIVKQLPTYQTQGVQDRAKQVQELKEQVAAQQNLTVLSQGRPADQSLYKTKSGVAQIPGIKVTKKIVVKDIGLEPRVSSQDFTLPELALLRTDYKAPQPLKGPENLYKSEKTKWFTTVLPTDFSIKGTQRKDYGLGQIVTKESVDKTDPSLKKDMAIAELAYSPLSDDEKTMLGALIIYSQGKSCHIVAGLFSDLNQNKKLKDEANFYLGICAHEMGFYAESVYRLLEVIKKEDPDFTSDAIKTIVSNIPMEYEIPVAKVLLKLKNKSLLPKEALDNVNYILAKGSVKQKDYNGATKYATQVKPESNKFGKAQFIIGISQYATNNVGKAIVTLTAAKDWLKSRSSNDKETASLVSVNLARMYFQNNQYNLANQEYLKVDKDSSYWVQALVEQGWAQLLMNDPSGAIGNMYSLHSPYFNSVYKPESFAVRTIGYLDICQYGDAYQTLKLMEDRYRPWIQKVGSYINHNKKPLQYYGTIKSYLQGKSTKDVDGVPYQLLREIARKRNFLNFQDSINQKIDEVAQYKFIDKMILKDKAKLRWRKQKSNERMVKAKQLLAKSANDKTLLPRVNEFKANIRLERKFIASMNFQIDLLEKGRQGFARLKKKAVARIEKEKSKLKYLAGEELKTNLAFVRTQMQKVLENNELLRFEVFSGSGENIRFQVAGGKTKGENRLPASYKPSKTLNWSVTGEYWQDEIGSYRSQLKNNCPKKTRLPGDRGQAKNY